MTLPRYSPPWEFSPVRERDSFTHQRRERAWRCQGFLIQESSDGMSGMAHLCTLPKYHYPPCYCWCEMSFTPEIQQPFQESFFEEPPPRHRHPGQ